MISRKLKIQDWLIQVHYIMQTAELAFLSILRILKDPFILSTAIATAKQQ